MIENGGVLTDRFSTERVSSLVVSIPRERCETLSGDKTGLDSTDRPVIALTVDVCGTTGRHRAHAYEQSPSGTREGVI